MTKEQLESLIGIYTPCKLCKEGYEKYKDGTFAKCLCKKDYDHKALLLYRLIQYGFISNNPVKEQVDFILNYSLKNYKGKDELGNLLKVETFIEKFKKRYSSMNLFLYGEPGTQKSTVARYIGKSLLEKRGLTCHYTLANTLIIGLVNASRNEEQKEWVTKLLNTDCLIIDEMDEEKIITYESGWQRKHVLPFLKERIEIQRKSVIFVSNKEPDNIGEYFEGSIQDLISREVLDKTMKFNDNFMKNRDKIDLKKLWE
jgi:DNA replication protein DnaC